MFCAQHGVVGALLQGRPIGMVRLSQTNAMCVGGSCWIYIGMCVRQKGRLLGRLAVTKQYPRY